MCYDCICLTMFTITAIFSKAFAMIGTNDNNCILVNVLFF